MTLSRPEPRTLAAGQIRIELSHNGRVMIGHLLNVSPHGFAIHYYDDQLHPNQQVSVLYEWGNAPARVVWVERKSDHMVAGFRTD